MKKILFFFVLVLLLKVTYSAANMPPALFVSITCGSYNCQVACNQSTGSLTADGYSGTPPYTYLWSTAATSQTISNLPVGTYTVTVYDAVGDSASSFTSISNYGNGLQAAAVAVPYTIFACDNQCTGWIRYDEYYLFGTPPYTVTTTAGAVDYNPYPSGAAFTIVNICHGATLNITVTDALGCTGQENSMSPFGYPNEFIVNPTFNITPACSSMANGSIGVTGLGTTWYYNSLMKLTTDTNTAYNPYDMSAWINAPWTFNNLLPGTYYLGIIFEYTYPADGSPPGCIDYTTCYYGCPKYVAVTVPDLGPNCSTVEGDVYVDLNASCTEDAGEIGVPNTVIQFLPGPYYALTDASGHYSSNLIWGNYNMTHNPPAALTQLCPANPFPILLSAANPNDTVNFADTSNVPFDISAYLSHGAAHPGFNFEYGVSVHNLSYTSSGMITVTLTYDPLLSFVSANPAPFSTSSGQVVWHLGAITNFQSTDATVWLSVPPNPALIGDTLNASVNIQAATSETNLANNTASTWHIITGSFDPNVKTVENPPAAFIPALDSIFNYTIQFQNTGSDTAFNIEVIDTLDSDLNVLTFVPGASSHPYAPDITGQGVLHFHFNNILLPDSGTDETHSHGFVSFQIRCKANRSHGTTILNHSDIIFDFNPPVATNTTTNTVDLTLAINASATTICAGQQVTLTMIPELQNTWRWRAGSCSSAIIGSGNSITVSPAVTTTYFVRDSAGTIPVGNCYRKTIIVNPLPSVSITPSGPTTFCQGSSVTLTSSAANSYLWSNSSSTQSINVTASGNYAVTVTAANGCTASSSAVSVMVNPLPAASITPSGPTTFCQGNSVTLTSSAASSYLWSNSSTTQNINVTSSGNYVVTVTDANTCTASTSLSVTVNPNPPAPAITQGGDSLTSDAATTYQWYFNSVLIPGATSQSYHPTQNGNYSVVISDANNCTASSTDYPFVLTGAKDLTNEKEISIYPNPAQGELVVRCRVFGDKSEIIMLNVMGETILRQKPKANSQQQAIDVSALPRGIYFIKVKLEEKIVLRKIVLM